jgi:hypothetical protein
MIDMVAINVMIVDVMITNRVIFYRIQRLIGGKDLISSERITHPSVSLVRSGSLAPKCLASKMCKSCRNASTELSGEEHEVQETAWVK